MGNRFYKRTSVKLIKLNFTLYMELHTVVVDFSLISNKNRISAVYCSINKGFV